MPPQAFDHRNHPAQLLVGGDKIGAGALDSPPMSRIPAPSASSSRAWAIAAPASV